MSIIPIEVAMQHVYADEADKEQVQRKLASAIATAEQYMGRRVYATLEDWYAAKEKAEADIKTIVTPTATSSQDDNNVVMQLQFGVNQMLFHQSKMAILGVLMNPAIEAGVLLILGDLYANRENTVQGGMAELPMAAKHHLQPFRLIGV